MSRITVSDEAIGEIVARSGGYEEVERAGRWARLANSLGLRKEMGPAVKARYEDMLRISAEADEREDEDEDEEYEVEDILDSRTDEKGNIEYLVKWKDVIGDEGEDDEEYNDNTTWEPREHLACPELLQQFEEKQRRQQQGGTVDAATTAAEDSENGAANEASICGHKRTEPESSTAECDSWQRILRVQKPDQEGGSMIFEVQTSDGPLVYLPNEKIRSEAPLLLVDFYEARLNFQ